jgi:hypothetical protein
MRLGRTTAAVVVGIAVLAGCSNGETANETLPPATSSAAPTSAALQPLGPVDFPMPQAARERTEAGALAAGKYFLQLTVRAYQRGDVDPVLQLSSQCEYCESLISGVREDVAAGNRITGGEINIEDPGQVVLHGNDVEVAFTVSQTPLVVSSSTGEVLADRAQPAFRSFTSLAATWSATADAWIVHQVTIS